MRNVTGTWTRVGGPGTLRVGVRVGAKIPMGYPCRTLPVLDPVLELFDEAQPEGFDYLSDGLINLPEDSVVDTESDGYANGPEPEEESDGDHEKDEDYVMGVASQDEDSDDSDIIREYDGQPWGFFGQPAPVPGKTRTRSHGCGFPMGTGVGFHETHVSDAPGKEYIKTRFRPIKTRHDF
jgi:hypothetical protein